MTRRDWWIGIAAIVLSVLAHNAIPRYDWRTVTNVLVRIDRWTGRAEWGQLSSDGDWIARSRVAPFLDDHGNPFKEPQR